MPGCLADIGRYERFTTYKAWSRGRAALLLPKTKPSLVSMAKEPSELDTSFFCGALLDRVSDFWPARSGGTTNSEGQMTGHDRINSVLVFQRNSSRPHKKMARRICAFYDATAISHNRARLGLETRMTDNKTAFLLYISEASNESHSYMSRTSHARTPEG